MLMTIEKVKNEQATINFDEVEAFEGTEHYKTLKQRFLMQYLDCCHSVAKYLHRGHNKVCINLPQYDELVDSGWEGLCDAFEAYNPEKGTFSTYATWHIKNRVLQEIRKYRTVKISPAIIDMYCKVRKMEDDGMKVAEICSALDLKESRLKRIKEVMKPIASLNFKIDEEVGEMELEDNRYNPYAETVKTEEMGRMNAAVNKLNTREKLLLELRYKKDMKLREISEIVGLTMERCRQLIQVAIEKLQKQLV